MAGGVVADTSFVLSLAGGEVGLRGATQAIAVDAAAATIAVLDVSGKVTVLCLR